MYRRGDGREQKMSTFNDIADIIADTCSIDRASITPESNAIKDLNIDSLDFLDVTFAIDRKFGIQLPVESWTKEISDGAAKMEDYFVLGNIARAVDALTQASPVRAPG